MRGKLHNVDCDDDNGGGDEGIGGDGENKEPSTIRITSPTVHPAEYVTGTSFDITWKTTGNAKNNDVCISIQNDKTMQFHDKYNGKFRIAAARGGVRAKFLKRLPLGSYVLTLQVRKRGVACGQNTNTKTPGHSKALFHVAPPATAVCGNGILEGDEVCDYGVLNNDENKYRCGPMSPGNSGIYFNEDGVGSPTSRTASACIRQCGSILPGDCEVNGNGSFCYHWGDSSWRSAGDTTRGFTPRQDGFKTCTPE